MPDNQQNSHPDEEVISLIDEAGRDLPCYIEDFFEFEGKQYVVLIAANPTVDIVACDDEAQEALVVQDEATVDEIFPIAEAVLAEKNLTLKRTPFVLTLEGELPEPEEDDIISVSIQEDGGNDPMEADELQFLAGFYQEEQKYEIYARLNPPLVFVGRLNQQGKAELLSQEEFDKISPLLEEQPLS